MKSKSTLFSFLVIAIISKSALGDKSPVKQDGKAITDEPGIFNGCYYGPNESISDHAPVLYGNLGTWNITLPINHLKIHPPGKPGMSYLNHTFVVNDEGIVTDRDGNAGDLTGDSEHIVLKKIMTPERIKALINKTEAEEIVRDTTQITKQLDNAEKKSHEILRNTELSTKVIANWKNYIKELKALAIAEIENPDEEKFHNTLALLSFVERDFAQINNKYIKRIEAIAEKIKEFFNKNSQLDYIVLQELPRFSVKNIAGEVVGKLLKEIFEPQDPWFDAINRVFADGRFDDAGILHIDTDKLENIFGDAPERIPDGDTKALLKKLMEIKKTELLAIRNEVDESKKESIRREAMGKMKNLLGNKDDGLIFDLASERKTKLPTQIAKTNFRKNNYLDVGIVRRASAPMVAQETMADFDNRLVPWCSKTTNKCYVSAHLPLAETDQELKLRCSDIKSMALSLRKKGYKEIKIAGDFNVPASRIARVCRMNLQPPRGSKGIVSVHSTMGLKGSSCQGGNTGELVSENIDIMIKYLFK